MKRAAFPAAAVAIALLGFALRVQALGRADLWGDEAVSWAVASSPLSEVPSRTVQLEAKPPLYFLALHVWMGVFGDSEGSIRALSLMAWPPFALLMVLLGRRVCPRWPLLPLLLAALSPLLVTYGVEARPYALQLAAETAFLWLAFRVDEEESLRLRVLLAAGSLLVLSLQFTGIFFIVPILTVLLLKRRGNHRELARLLIPQGVAALLVGALVLGSPGLASRLGALPQEWWASFPSASQVLSSPVRLLAPVVSWKTYIDLSHRADLLLLPCAAFLFLMAAYGLAIGRHRKLLLTATAGVLGPVVLYSLLRANLLFERYYIGVAPVLLLGVGVALEALTEQWPGSWKGLLPAAIAAQLVILGLLPPFGAAAEYRPAVEALLARERGSLAVLTGHWDGPSVRYYVRKEAVRVRLHDGVGAALADPTPLYYLRSRSWGDRSGVLDSALKQAGTTMTPVYDAGGTAVFRIDRGSPK